VDAQDEAQRKAKAYRVQKLGFDFLDAYKLAFGDGACTPYVHMAVCHLATQIYNIEVDIMELSGQALEHLNLKRKGDGRHTNGLIWTAADVTKHAVRKRGMMDQLMQTEYNRKEASLKVRQRASDHERKVARERKKVELTPKHEVVSRELLKLLRPKAHDPSAPKRRKYESGEEPEPEP
jgi:hypothetical protein